MLRLIFVTSLAIRFGVPSVWALIRRDKAAVKQSVAAGVLGFCNAAGGVLPKLGQILATRADVVPEHLRAALNMLQDRCKPIHKSTLQGVIANTCFGWIESEPVACGSIAQVHRGKVDGDTRVFALKVRRPRIASKLESDCRIIRQFGRIVALLQRRSSIPIRDALADSSEALIRQADFCRELENHQRLIDLFKESSSVIVPNVYPELSSEEILVTEFIEDLRRLDDPELSESKVQEALTIGIRALYRMIFQAGFIHCDLHPANMLLAPDGRLVILDAGFMVEVDSETRRSFCDFFLAIVDEDGLAAAEIIRCTAVRLPTDLNVEAFDQEIASLIVRTGGLRAGEFQVAGFVSELFSIQTKHGISGTSQFTLIILALLVFEGVAKQRFPSLDFQRQAVPFLVEAIASRI